MNKADNILHIEKLNKSNRKRYTLENIKVNLFYQIPKFLFEDEFKNLSNDSKILYALLKDKHEESIENNWINENNEVYLEYTRNDMQEILGLSKPTVIKAVNELIKYGLLEEERIGKRKANRLFLTAVTVENSMR